MGSRWGAVTYADDGINRSNQTTPWRIEMSLLTDSDIEELYFTEVDNRIMSFAHAIEAAVVAKLATVSVEPVTVTSKLNEFCSFSSASIKKNDKLYPPKAIAATKVQTLNRNLLP